MMLPDAPKQIQAVDDQGAVWSLTEDSQVGDWLRYIEDGGTIDPYVPDAAAKPAEPPRDLYAEIDDLEARVTALEAKPVATAARKPAPRGKKK